MKKLAALACLLLVLLSACDLFAPRKVKYTVIGAGTRSVAWIVYSDDDGVKDLADTTLPWSKSFEVPQKDSAYLAVSAWNAEDSGTITCSIYVDGDLVDSETDSVMASAEHYL